MAAQISIFVQTAVRKMSYTIGTIITIKSFNSIYVPSFHFSLLCLLIILDFNIKLFGIIFSAAIDQTIAAEIKCRSRRTPQAHIKSLSNIIIKHYN